GEAVNLEPHGIRLSKYGEITLTTQDPKPARDHNESSTLWYRLLEEVPRWEIDNSGEWPTRRGPVSGATGKREPGESRRENGKIFVHKSAFGGEIEVCDTKGLPQRYHEVSGGT